MIYKTLVRVIFSVALILGLFSALPSHASAIDFNPFNPLDPFCLFSCDFNSQPQTVYNTTDSYNTNSFNTTNTNSSTYTSTYLGGGGVYATTPVYNTPIYNSPIYNTPVYTYNSPSYAYNSPLSVSCYPTPTSANVGSSVTWGSSVSGGNGSYYISWSGTEGLYGTGSTISKSYGYAGSKNASVTVISDGQSVSQNCSGTVTIYDYNYGTPTPVYTYPPVYNPPTYYPPTYYPLSVSCRANTTFSTTGSYVTWSAYASGGYNNYGYTYSWSGTDGVYGSQSSISAYYSTPGVKTAYVTVYSNGQNTTVQCSNSVTVGAPVATYPVQYITPQYTGGVLQVACGASVTSAKIGAPVTWDAEAYGSTGRFVYSWSGTDNLFGTQSSAITSYSTAGTKNAIVTVTASNGQSVSKVCKNTVTVKGAAVAAKKAPVQVAPASAPQVVVLPPPPVPGSETSLLSLKNVPWGWVAVLVILVLIGMVFYLLFNKKKI